MDESKPNQTNDDEQHWKNGIYNNPDDPRVWVPKRYGVGYTLNTGSRKGKRFFVGTLIAVGIILLVVILMFLLPVFNPFKLSIGADNVTIQSPIYATGFPISGIREVKLVDTLPGGTRTNGISTGTYNLGNFTLNGYGKSKMYVYNADSPFLVISLDNLTVFYNSKNPEQTRLIYSQLLQDIK
jgi:Family of unknown function (DUF5808)/Bacterial PH domain